MRIPKIEFPCSLKDMDEFRQKEVEKNTEYATLNKKKKCSNCVTCSKSLSSWKDAENTGKLGCYMVLMAMRKNRKDAEKVKKQRESAVKELSKIYIKEIKEHGIYTSKEFKKMNQVQKGILLKMYGIKTVGINEKYIYKMYKNTVKTGKEPMVL